MDEMKEAVARIKQILTQIDGEFRAVIQESGGKTATVSTETPEPDDTFCVTVVENEHYDRAVMVDKDKDLIEVQTSPARHSLSVSDGMTTKMVNFDNRIEDFLIEPKNGFSLIGVEISAI